MANVRSGRAIIDAQPHLHKRDDVLAQIGKLVLAWNNVEADCRKILVSLSGNRHVDEKIVTRAENSSVRGNIRIYEGDISLGEIYEITEGFNQLGNFSLDIRIALGPLKGRLLEPLQRPQLPKLERVPHHIVP